MSHTIQQELSAILRANTDERIIELRELARDLRAARKRADTDPEAVRPVEVQGCGR